MKYKTVKDKLNLVNHNIWSCCEYTKTLPNDDISTSLVTGNTLTITNEFSSIGETCLDLYYDPSATTYPFFDFKYYYPPEYIGKSITVTADAFRNNNQRSCQLILNVNNENLSSVGITSTNFQKVSNSITLPDSNLLLIRFVIWRSASTQSTHLYVDNISVTIQ